jgi:Tfp pilus assembly protein PilF
LLELKSYESALTDINKVIELTTYPAAYNTRGAILKKLGRYKDALADFNMVLQLDKTLVDGYNNRGVLVQELGDPTTAIKDYNNAISFNSTYVEAWANRASAYQDLNQLDKTLSDYDQALTLRPQDPMIRMHRAFALLTDGQYEEGWKEYEWRKKTPVFADAKQYGPVVYTGEESLEGNTILLYTEQGLGDSIQFSRYINLISEKAAEVLLEVEQPLLYLFAASFPDNVKLIKKGYKIPKFDYHCSLMSLPLAFGTTVDTIPYAQSYLISDPLKRKHWHKKLGAHDKLRVGLVWNGGFRPDRIDLWYVNLRRNILLEKFAVLSNLDINFYSLQKGEAAETELAKLKNKKWKGPRIIDYTQDLIDLSDTAALIENLDLVITVDTSVAHLAAGLGKPTWVLNRFDSCWRWMRNREDSPWYSAVKLYTQETYGDWDNVLEKVRTDLLKYKL